MVSILNDWLLNTANNLALRRIVDAVLESPGLGVPTHKARKKEKKAEREAALLLIAQYWDPVLKGQAGSFWEAVQQKSANAGLHSDIHGAIDQVLKESQSEATLERFFTALANHVHPWKGPQEFLSETSAWVEAMTTINPTSLKTNVRLMTFQSAKGLEAKVVCVIGLEDGIIPREGSEADLAEQSRLLYVTMTRAKSELHLFHARKRSSYVVQRNIYQNKGQPDLSRSRFLDSISKDHSETAYHRY